MTDLNPHICSVLGPARRRLACVLIVGVLATLPSTAAAEMELPAPPTAAQAFTARQLLKWIGSLARHSPLTREVLAAKLPATFSPRQETRTRISWQAHLSRVSNWFAEVEFILDSSVGRARWYVRAGVWREATTQQGRSLQGGATKPDACPDVPAGA